MTEKFINAPDVPDAPVVTDILFETLPFVKLFNPVVFIFVLGRFIVGNVNPGRVILKKAIALVVFCTVKFNATVLPPVRLVTFVVLTEPFNVTLKYWVALTGAAAIPKSSSAISTVIIFLKLFDFLVIFNPYLLFKEPPYYYLSETTSAPFEKPYPPNLLLEYSAIQSHHPSFDTIISIPHTYIKMFW